MASLESFMISFNLIKYLFYNNNNNNNNNNNKAFYSDFQVASELNAAILKMENRESSGPKLSSLLKLILWSQDELDKKKIKYPKMSNLANAEIESPK